jgi:hypothetical protein
MHARIFQGQNEWGRQTDPVPVLKGYAAELALEAGSPLRCRLT